MSSDIAIRAEHIGKRYRTGATQGVGRYRSLREDITGLATRSRRKAEQAERDFWALKDVSFEIKAGETVGIIGRNGAGKSTMLKILARITPPTSGRGETVGRVGSLLEVGTGFHPELTGRENIMLSAAIMGMRRSEVFARFDDIVEFSGLAQFLDTPVKRYSSGMYMRLAFSVAAHLEPEILLVDEVLAVGDAEFQKKGLEKMEDLSGTGRTVLFVSHSMPSVLRLCPRVILLDRGGVVSDGSAGHVLDEYLSEGGGASRQEWRGEGAMPGDERVRLRSVRLLDEGSQAGADIDIRHSISVEITYTNLSAEPNFRPFASINVFDSSGTLLFGAIDASNRSWRNQPRREGIVTSVCDIPGNFLSEGSHFITVAVGSQYPTITHVHVQDALAFHVVDRSDGDGARGDYLGDFGGNLRPLLTWRINQRENP